ncbi:acid protease [Fusarium langsethiae]|uniref:Acid protease n=1 Tax=Fusarium langsethiae TaxID=179993 RepID=A0A0N0DGE6_FUSLA|nr:acid protease [Fusarium langsethiae]GKU06021.1 unnamed protein product [Fusarium langsethiae]GKU20989.1 unnamed protein product [Fusarium langsethiae]
MFEPNESSSWSELGTYGIDGGGVGLEANLGYIQAAKFGLDTLGIGLFDGENGITLENQTIGGIATASPFYLGIFGINPQPLNFTTLGNFSSPSFITTLKNDNYIPSLSWSYTAGAMYRLKKIYGQLIFAGYDSSRFIENPVTFTMANDVTRDLVVALQAISYSGAEKSQLLESPINIYIDSTDPNIWLPDDAVDAFESAFDLTLDNTTGLYLVNGSHHEDLLASNAEVSFRLSDVLEGGSTVIITLPYRAFDLKAEYPLVDKTSYYFPLKRATDESQYTLGRVFLQEAYLTVDYERGIFNVSQCAWVEGAKQHLVTITSRDEDEDPPTDTVTTGGKGGTASTNRETSDSTSLRQSLSSGVIAGTVIGVVAGLVIVASASYVLVSRRRSRSRPSKLEIPEEVTSEGGDSHESGSCSILKGPQELPGVDNQIHQLHAESKEEVTGARVQIYELPDSERQEIATYIEPVSSASSPTMVEGSIR